MTEKYQLGRVIWKDKSAFDAAIALFRRRVLDPRAWQDTARGLVWSANKLWAAVDRRTPLGFSRGRRPLTSLQILAARHHSLGPTILLFAYAVENYLKALLIARGTDPVLMAGRKRGRLRPGFATHSLRDLAAAAAFDYDTAFLDRLTEFAISGKYPTGIDPGSGTGIEGYFPDAVLQRIVDLLPRLEQALAATGRRELLPSIDPLRLGRRPRTR